MDFYFVFSHLENMEISFKLSYTNQRKVGSNICFKNAYFIPTISDSENINPKNSENLGLNFYKNLDYRLKMKTVLIKFLFL